uniref:ephrin-A1-like n=1 Tax=Styela clava TaxID=7725 RepID=UPI00193A58BF|nr:ephrin-A1-like [Styela clava]
MDKQIVISLLSVFVLQGASGTRHVVYWDKSLIPELSIKDGLDITVEINDWMDLLCPYTVTRDSIWRSNERESFLHLYNVTKEAYMNCDTRGGIRLQSCDDPYTEKKLTTKFQERSPYPFGFTFRPGATYYYISKPLYDSSIGCTQDTLKMRVNVNRKGTGSTRRNNENKKTYHIMPSSEESATIPGNVEDISGDQRRKEKRHHHHTRFQSQTTTPAPKIAIRIVTSQREAVSGSVRSDGSENYGYSATRSTRTTNYMLLAIVVCCTYLHTFFDKCGSNL